MKSSFRCHTGFRSKTSSATRAATACCLKPTRTTGFRVTAEMIERLITPRTKLIILNSPSNPSGAVMSPEDLNEVVRLAAERGIWVISDECYVYLNYTGKRFSVGSLRDIAIAWSLLDRFRRPMP